MQLPSESQPLPLLPFPALTYRSCGEPIKIAAATNGSGPKQISMQMFAFLKSMTDRWWIDVAAWINNVTVAADTWNSKFPFDRTLLWFVWHIESLCIHLHLYAHHPSRGAVLEAVFGILGLQGSALLNCSKLCICSRLRRSKRVHDKEKGIKNQMGDLNFWLRVAWKRGFSFKFGVLPLSYSQPPAQFEQGSITS